MATPFDPSSIFPPFYDAPDPSALQWPWSQPPAPDPALAAAPVPPVELVQPPADPMLAMIPPEAPAPLPPVEAPIAAPVIPPAPMPEPGVPLPPVPELGPAPAPITELPSVADAGDQSALNRRALTDPAGFAEDVTRSNQDRATYIATRRKEMADADIAAARQNAEDRKAADAITQQKLDAVMADAARIANTKIDPTGGLSGGRQIAGVLGAIIGGLVQGRTGAARNAGMDALTETINRGIDAQKADLANQREGVNLKHNVLAQEFARHGDMFRAEETVRLAALQHADDFLASEQQNYDLRGRTGILIAGERAKVAAAQQQAGVALADKTREQVLKEREQSRKDAETIAKIQHDRQTIGVEYANLGSAAQDRALQRQIHATDKADAAAAKTKEEHDKQILERTIGGEVYTKPDGSQGVRAITMANGDPFIPTGTTTDVTNLRQSHDANVEVIAKLDRIRQLGPEWLSDTGNSDKKQKLDQAVGDAKLSVVRAKKLGVITGDDERYALDSLGLGTKSVSGVRGVLAGINEARTSFVAFHNRELQHAGLDKPWSPTDTSTLPTGPETFQPTSIERGQAATPGSLTRAATERLSFTDPSEKLREGVVAAENAPAGPTGLATEDSTKVVGAIKAASSAAPFERAALVDKIAAWAQSPRESVANGVLGLLRGESPALYNEVVAKLPAAQRKALPDFSGLPGANLPPLPGARPHAAAPVWNGTDWVIPGEGQ